MMLGALAALLVGGSAVAAGPNDPSVQIKAPEVSYKLHADEFKDFAHTYVLADSKAIRFSQSGRRYWARLAGENKVELYPMAANVFVTAAGARIEFSDQGEQVAIDNYERLPMSVALGATNVRMVASR
ncbi:hypothetical protein [Pseudoduganella sp.]|uniref:hypothetical protein n=1 Tax=Pseudoduganella sp. TaxID=1880898 RepID=UPI0035B489E7